MSTATLQPKKDPQDKPKNVFEAILRYGHDEDFDTLITPDFREDYLPTAAPPGSPEKIEVLRERVEKGQPLWHVGDRRDFRGFRTTLVSQPADQYEMQTNESLTLPESFSAISDDVSPTKTKWVPKLSSGEGGGHHLTPEESREVERNARVALNQRQFKKRAALKEQELREAAVHAHTDNLAILPSVSLQVGAPNMPAPIQVDTTSVLNSPDLYRSPPPSVLQQAKARREFKDDEPGVEKMAGGAPNVSESHDRLSCGENAQNDGHVGMCDTRSGAPEVVAKQRRSTSDSGRKPQDHRGRSQKANSIDSDRKAAKMTKGGVYSDGGPNVIKIPQQTRDKVDRSQSKSISQAIIPISAAARIPLVGGTALPPLVAPKAATDPLHVHETMQSASAGRESRPALDIEDSLEECVRRNSITNSALEEYMHGDEKSASQRDPAGLTKQQKEVLQMLRNLEEAVKNKWIMESALTQFKNEHRELLRDLALRDVCA